MRKNGLINKISSKNIVPSVKSMQVLDEQSKAYFNFINSLKSESTRKSYKVCLERFLNHYKIDLASLLKLPQDELTNLIIKYLVEKKISKQYKNLMSATLKHACEMNDVVLNWKKIKKFINSEKTGNETNGRDRGYEDKEIQKILEFSDQRLKTAFLVLASSGIRIGALQTIRIGDLEKIDDLYKIVVYSGDKEEYTTFSTPECAKEIDSYLEIEKKKKEPEFKREYMGQYLGKVGNVFSSSQIDESINLGLEFSTAKLPVSLYTLKSVGIDPGFSSSSTGICVLEHIKIGNDNKHMIRVVDCHLIDKGDPNEIVQILWDIWKQYGYMNVAYYIDGSNRAMVNLLKIRWQESLSWESTESFGSNVKIRPVNFNTEHRNMLSNLHALVSKGFLAIDPKYDKLITSLRTAYAEELNLKKDIGSYSDLLDALRLALKAYHF